MIIKVKIDEQVYEVEIDDLQKRPIIAVLEGEEFEVWPEGEPTVRTRAPAHEYSEVKHSIAAEGLPQSTHKMSLSPVEKANDATSSAVQNSAHLVVRAPIPGVITAVSTQAGAEVTAGQQLCVLEAMKMNNSIRASRPGHIAVVHVTVGQHVKHHDILLEYTD